MPTETEFATSLEGNNRPAKVPVLEATPESLQKFTAPAATAAPQALPPLPPSYPPLEPTSR